MALWNVEFQYLLTRSSLFCPGDISFLSLEWSARCTIFLFFTVYLDPNLVVLPVVYWLALGTDAWMSWGLLVSCAPGRVLAWYIWPAGQILVVTFLRSTLPSISFPSVFICCQAQAWYKIRRRHDISVGLAHCVSCHEKRFSDTYCQSNLTAFSWSCRRVEVPFASPEHASIAKQVIDVDKELQPQAVKRELSVDGNKLIAFVFFP